MGFGSGISCDFRLNTVLTPEQQERYQNAEVIRRLVFESKNIAVVGLSSDKQRASYFVASYLQYEGYRIIPINPKGGVILGENVYEKLADIPDTIQIDMVDVFRPLPEIPSVVEQSIARGAKSIWLQLRLIDFESADKALAAGLDVVMDKCVKMEHGRFGGGLHSAGMNTEVITAKRARILKTIL